MQNNRPKRKLLLIDDDPISLEVLCLLLSASDFLVTTAAGPTEALALLDEPALSFDLILTDVQMPEMSCSDLIQALQTKSRAPLFAMSGSYPEQSALAGSSGFLLKPFEVDSLVALLDNLPAPQRKPSQTTRVLDREKLLRAMPEKAAQQVYGAFLEDLPIRLRNLDEIMQTVPLSAKDLAKQAHILRGSSAMIGAEQLTADCARLEEAGGTTFEGVIERGDFAAMLNGIRDAAAILEGMLKSELAGTTGKQE
jgi:CheY-like chemotaxis protein